MSFKRFDVATELRHVREQPAKAANLANPAPELSDFSDFSRGAPAVSPDYRAHYHRAAEAVQEECFVIDPVWLLDRHPELWEQLAALDDELAEMERAGAEEQAYRTTLGHLVACVQKARSLYEEERSDKAVQ